MKLTAIITLFISLSAFAHQGHSVAGGVTLSGFMKTLFMSNSIPLGGITSFYGYEGINFPHSTPVYCYGGVGLSSSGSILGASFGGSGGTVKTVGECHEPKDFLGGFLSIALNYKLSSSSSGSKDASVQASFGLGFDLGLFNKKLMDAFHNYSDDERGIRARVKTSALHLIKYAGVSSAKKLGKDYLWLKLLSLPLTVSMGSDWKQALSHLKFSMQELKTLEKREAMFALKNDLSELFQRVKRDPSFYSCKNYTKECEKIYVDTYYLMEAIEEAMGSCHSVSLSVNAATSYDLNIPILTTKLNYSFTYSYYGLKEEKEARASTIASTMKAYSFHRFWTKNKSCSKVEVQAAEAFGEFLSIMGVKK